MIMNYIIQKLLSMNVIQLALVILFTAGIIIGTYLLLYDMYCYRQNRKEKKRKYEEDKMSRGVEI